VTQDIYSCVSGQKTIPAIGSYNDPVFTGTPVLTSTSLTMPSVTFDSGTALQSYTVAIIDSYSNYWYAFSGAISSIASPLNITEAYLETGNTYTVYIIVYDQRGRSSIKSWNLSL